VLFRSRRRVSQLINTQIELLKMSKSRDIEYEMSRFEEEITKLSPATTTTASNYVISASPISSYTIKPRVTMGIPSMGNMGMPSSFSTFSYQQQMTIPVNPFLPPLPIQSYKPPATIPKIVTEPTSTSAFKRDSSGNIINNKANAQQPTTAAAAAVAAAAASSEIEKKKGKDNKVKKNKKFIRAAGGQTWEDETLLDWDPDDFRLFCGDLGNEVNDESLSRAFQKYPSFQKGKVIRDKRTGKTKGYGFVSFKDSTDFIKAMREMDGKYVGNRPIKLRKSNWMDRNLEMVRKKEQEKQKMGLR